MEFAGSIQKSKSDTPTSNLVLLQRQKSAKIAEVNHKEFQTSELRRHS